MKIQCLKQGLNLFVGMTGAFLISTAVQAYSVVDSKTPQHAVRAGMPDAPSVFTANGILGEGAPALELASRSRKSSHSHAFTRGLEYRSKTGASLAEQASNEDRRQRAQELRKRQKSNREVSVHVRQSDGLPGRNGGPRPWLID